jgi:citrate synthase
MRWLTQALLCLTVAAAAGRSSQAAEPDAAELAALIDRHIDARLKAEGVAAAGLADDAEFVRRVYLVLHGVVPTAEQAARFRRSAEHRSPGTYAARVAGPNLHSPLSLFTLPHVIVR